MTNKKLERILVVGDNLIHLKDAGKFFSGVKGVDVYYATTFSEAQEVLGAYPKPEVDGVITDIYLPIGGISSGERKGDEYPIGLLVAAQCHMNNLPFVFCIEEDHHDDEKYNWISVLQETMRWPEIIDTSSDNTEAEHKQWYKAYKTLKTLVENPSK